MASPLKISASSMSQRNTSTKKANPHLLHNYQDDPHQRWCNREALLMDPSLWEKNMLNGWTSKDLIAFGGHTNAFKFLDYQEQDKSKCPGFFQSDPFPNPDCLWCHKDHQLLVVFDTETTSTSKKASICEFGAIVKAQRGHFIQYYSHLWKIPGREKMNWRAQKIHGIKDDDINFKGINPKKDLIDLCRLIEHTNTTTVCHNFSFDFRMLLQTCTQLNVSCPDPSNHRCTMKMATAMKKKGKVKNVKLGALYEELMQRSSYGAHRALKDAQMTLKVFLTLNKK